MQPLPAQPPNGVPLTSNVFPTGFSAITAANPAMELFSGVGYGFIIEGEPITGLIPHVIAVEVRGINQQGSQIIFVTVDKWYDVPFSKLTVVSKTPARTLTAYTGTLVVNVATAPWVIIRPSRQNEPVPAASGGVGLQDYEIRSQVDVNDPPPTSQVDGVGLFANPQSMLSCTIFASESPGVTITGGTVDVWYYDWQLNNQNGTTLWALLLAGAPVPTGAAAARIPFGVEASMNIGVRYGGVAPNQDRFRVVPNGITLSNGVTTLLSVATYIQ